MDVHLYQQLREAAIDRVMLKDIAFLYAKTSKRTTDTKSVKGSYYFKVAIHVVTGADDELDYQCLVKFVPRMRDFFVFRVFQPDEKLLTANDALIEYLEQNPEKAGAIDARYLNAVRLRQIKEIIVRFFQNNDYWLKSQKLVSYNPEQGQVSIVTIEPEKEA